MPIVLPRDDGPHDRLTEWWYYTGHLLTSDGRHLGFEFVVFRAERGRFPTTWASHFAVTDETGHRFVYGQRQEIGAQVDHSPRSTTGIPTGFDLRIAGSDPTQTAAPDRPAWSMAGSSGTDTLTAAMTAEEARAAGMPGGLGIDLRLKATKPPTLHDVDGWIDFGAAGGSYYYSRTAMTASGSVDLDGQRLAVTGNAWFDHQWGDFISVGGGGWDWFAVNLADGTDLTLSLIRDADGTYPLVYGTLVDARGTTRHLDHGAFDVMVTNHWTSSTSGATYPSAWTVAIPSLDLSIGLTPTVANQELDTRATTGVIYWEGSQRVRATHGGKPVVGSAYVELTGYASSLGEPRGSEPRLNGIRRRAVSSGGECQAGVGREGPDRCIDALEVADE